MKIKTVKRLALASLTAASLALAAFTTTRA